MEPTVLKDKFRGALIGTFIGDALGAPYEGWGGPAIRERVGKRLEMLDARLGLGSYTDDTEMMIALAESMVQKGKADGAGIARAFSEHYDARRGYGGGAKRTIAALKAGVSWENAAKRSFPEGSYGNGSAMRTAPVGALYWNDHHALRQAATIQSRVTHTHPDGIAGAIILSAAVAGAIGWEGEFDPEAFLDTIIEIGGPGNEFYEAKFSLALALLKSEASAEEIYNGLGAEVIAQRSVPSAIFSFLRNHNDFERAVTYAVCLGGDTDTVGAMCGAISGAFHGLSNIPKRWVEVLENEAGSGRDVVIELADKLFSMNTGEMT